MEKEFVPYEQALALKSLGFNEPCFGRYENKGKNRIWYEMPNQGQDTIPVGDSLAPLYQQAFRWFRENYGLDSFVKNLYKNTIKVGYYFAIDKYKGVQFQTDFDIYYKTYKEAELDCLIKLIEIVSNEK